MKGFIFTQELDGLESLEETALGYAMGNCLKLTDLMRYSINSNARLFCFWANGKRVGMSYSVGVTQNLLTGRKFEVGKNGEAKEVDVSELSDSLIDSIEIGDQFLKDMHKEYSTEEGKKIHDYLLVHRLVDNYLMSSLQDSRRGIYVLPESNNFLVRRAMGSFIESMGGVRVIEYSGVRVNTDTDFSKVPYWIDKQSLQGKVHTTMKCSDGSTEKDVKLSAEEAAEAYHMSDEAAESFVDLIGRITEFNESD